MSGFLGGTLNSLANANTALSLLTGGSPVTLGTVEFQSWEVPDRISYGGAQTMTVHRYPGGARTIDVMGRDDVDYTWSGHFGMFTPNSADRARTLDALRQSGAPVLLTWGDYCENVVVTSCRFEQCFDYIRYEMCVCVVSNPDAVPPNVSLIDSVNSDLSVAYGFEVGSALSTLINGVQVAANVIPILTGGSRVAVDLSAQLLGVTAQLGLAGGLASAAFGQLATSDGFLLGGPLALTAAVAAATQETGVYDALGYVSRASANVGAA